MSSCQVPVALCAFGAWEHFPVTGLVQHVCLVT